MHNTEILGAGQLLLGVVSVHVLIKNYRRYLWDNFDVIILTYDLLPRTLSKQPHLAHCLCLIPSSFERGTTGNILPHSYFVSAGSPQPEYLKLPKCTDKILLAI